MILCILNLSKNIGHSCRGVPDAFLEIKFYRFVYKMFLLFPGKRCMLETSRQKCLRKEALKGKGLRNMRRIAAFLMAVFMLAGVCAAAEPQISAEGLAMMGVLDSRNDLAETAAETPAETDAWKLLLVNPWNKIPEGYSVTLKKLANGLQVDERIYDDLNAMLTECWRLGMHPVVCSAYRPHATQVRLHNNKIARLRSAGYGYESAVKEAGRWVAVPGTSEHETGLALDIVSYSYQVLDEKQENTAEQKWFMEHCWEYGFILRYPKYKTEITGIGYEPWHYRYVGREAAAEMKELGLCLEEYIQTLENPVPAEQEQPEVLAEEMNQEAAVAAS